MKLHLFFRMSLPALSLVLLLSLSAGIPAPVPQENLKGPRLTDAQFFAMLDYSIPALGKVKKAVDRQDFALAKELLSSYMRKRSTPLWTFQPRQTGRDQGYNTSEAEKAMAHLLRSIGIEWQFGD